MSYNAIWVIIIVIIACQKASLSEPYRKFVYQKDMSEHCRRRVIPSVFLGRQIVDANSQMLHFSRLEVPYSCNINIRTDMGSNIIIVIQVFTDVDLETMCSQGNSQLLIYEMGETFGGYWGQVPDSVMKQDGKRKEHQYTLTPSQTEPTTTTTQRTTTTTPPTTSKPVTRRTKDKSEENEGEYFTIELPIVNISAHFVPGQLPPDSMFSTKDKFDLIYDVTPGAGEKYDTRLLPLIEVAVDKSRKKGKLRDDGSSDNDTSPEYQVRFDELFTPDPRLTIPPFDVEGHKMKTKFHPSVNRRLNFKKNKQLFAAKQALFKKSRFYNFLEPQPNKVYEYLQTTTARPDDQTDYKNNTWDVIKDILRNLTNTKEVPTDPPHEELANILRKVSMKELNRSVYLEPDLPRIQSRMPGAIGNKSEYKIDTSSDQSGTNHFVETDDTLGFKNVSQDSNKLSNYVSNVLDNNDSSIYNGAITVPLQPIALDVDGIIQNGTKQIKAREHNKSETPASVVTGTTTKMKKYDKPEPLTVSLVNHESWENVVNAAPVMAVKLNETTVTSTVATENLTKQAVNVTKPTSRRKRRYIHAIDIKVASPHHVQVMKHVTTTPPPEKLDMRDFQRLIELQDDEIHGRMSMRYLKQFVGQPLLKLCDFNETASRHVYLFNSSRLVLSLANFTLNRMMIVATPARTLLNTESRCAAAYLECQVSGARVCIDAHSACDGVPNCGSYDIYDEDRLTCGAAAGLRHNVCLAAITFLAVLLTVLYTIHYWLKRCIPKVSDAFFIYTDAAENVLYLEPLMRSPHDVGTGKEYYHGGMELYEYDDIVPKKNRCRAFFRRCLLYLRCRRRRRSESEVVEAELDNLYPQRLSNYAEMELSNMTRFCPTTDAAVQTGSSLEMAARNIEVTSFVKGQQLEDKASDSIDKLAFMEADLDSSQHSDELNVLQFLKRARTKSNISHRNYLENEFPDASLEILETKLVPQVERELKSHVYNPEHYSVDPETMPEQPSKLTVDKDLGIKPAAMRKRLRFHDETIIIPFDDELDDENAENAPSTSRRSVVFGPNKVMRLQDANDETNDGDEPSGTGREFKSYFNWGKERKKRKPNKKK